MTTTRLSPFSSGHAVRREEVEQEEVSRPRNILRAAFEYYRPRNQTEKMDASIISIFLTVAMLIAAMIITTPKVAQAKPLAQNPIKTYAPLVVDRPKATVPLTGTGGANTPTGTSNIMYLHEVKLIHEPKIQKTSHEYAAPPSWATPECLDRLAGIIQGEVGGIKNRDAWAFVGRNIIPDLHDCRYTTNWVTGRDGTAFERHDYEFEKRWYGRTEPDKIRPEFRNVARLVLLNSQQFDKFPLCKYVDNYEGSISRVPATIVTIGDDTYRTSATIYGSGCTLN